MTAVTVVTAPQAKMAAALRRAVVVPLSDLRGPAEGTLELPVAVFWSLPHASFDVADRKQRIAAYRHVFSAARRAEHLIPYLNAALLKDAWAEIGLPHRVRAAWEAVNPALAPAAVKAA